jgi:hypothetical protein
MARLHGALLAVARSAMAASLTKQVAARRWVPARRDGRSTQLWRAAEEGKTATVTRLVAAGASVARCDRSDAVSRAGPLRQAGTLCVWCNILCDRGPSCSPTTGREFPQRAVPPAHTPWRAALPNRYWTV